MNESAIEQRVDQLEAEQTAMREEMRAGFAEMREEMRARFATREEMQARFANREEMQAGFAQMREEMHAGFARMVTREELQEALARMATREEMEAGFARMATRDQMEAQRLELLQAIAGVREESAAANAEMREYVELVSRTQEEKTRRYFDVVAEGLRDDIRKLAEGHAATSQRLDRVEGRLDGVGHRMERLEQKMDTGFAKMRADIASLVTAIGGRQGRPPRR